MDIIVESTGSSQTDANATLSFEGTFSYNDNAVFGLSPTIMRPMLC